MKKTLSVIRSMLLRALLFSIGAAGTLKAESFEIGTPASPTGLVSGNSIVIDGAPSPGLIANLFAFDFLKSDGVIVRVNESDSERGIYTLLYKNCDIASTTRLMNDKELAEARALGVNPVPHTVALGAIVMVVHPGNSLKSLTIDQLRKIYSGAYTNWKEVGGKDRPIVLLQREQGSGTVETFNDIVMGKTPLSMKVITLFNNREIRSRINLTPNAIGYIGHSWIDKSVKPLLVNGIDHTSYTIKNEIYPLCRKLYMYTNGKPFGVLKRFVEYSSTAEGKERLTENGFIPVD
ncbi:phosphate ABC transporter substrate-binding protein [Chlorobium sp. BLA1]|uniref:phosphate ABC transporter substrate-binding protein n=1 Tax=Candidatus Chlorobium masyuteum TaxID=2716876 RepID=UPI00141F5554|nr:phosphate ABC transporter substrate-binding protein [Candidatus Chlorobium masyuteum]NHQ60233.1 phosphate ABC transporter substrate-binding protein [Candidatus Chlorobium masyuteum]